LGKDLRQTTIFLRQPAYERARAIAEQQNERLPVTLGNLIEFAVATVDAPKAARMETPLPTSIAKIELADLTKALLSSRFPGDTGAARFRQLAFVHLVATETMRGHRPTATTLAEISGSHKSQMDLLAKLLVERGVIMKTHAPGLSGAAAGKILSLAEDPIAGLQKAHKAATGSKIKL
jgi:hypothetical protein